MLLEASTHIRQPVEKVFAFLAHHPNHARFVKQNLSCEQVSPGEMGVGTRVKNVARLFGSLGGRIEEHFEIVTFERPRKLGKSSREGSSFETTDLFELSEADGGTNVRFTVTVTPNNFFKRALVSMMKNTVHGAMKDSLASLKQILES